MEKRIAGLLGAVATLGAFNAAQAAPISPPPADVLRANSLADLLEPIPNAAAVLQAVDESAPPASADGNIQMAQFYHHHHHHHHHHNAYRRFEPRIIVVPRRYRDHHHHHHHHHHHSQYYRY